MASEQTNLLMQLVDKVKQTKNGIIGDYLEKAFDTINHNAGCPNKNRTLIVPQFLGLY